MTQQNTQRFLLAAALMLAPLAANAGEAGKTTKPSTAATAFDRLKQLAGEWETSNSPVKTRVSYEVISGGSALVERDTAEGMPAMMTVYYLDGDRLLLTHYCMAGNQPRMQARGYNAATGELAFDFLDATNLASPKDGHMHSATLRFIDDDHFSAAWNFYRNGEKSQTEQFSFSRVK